MSIKAYEPSIKIALVHDNSAISHLTERELSMFDHLIQANPEDYTLNGSKQYQRMKLCVYKYSPFENSLYIDVDTMWFPKKPIKELIGKLIEHDFYIGKNSEYDPSLPRKRQQATNYTYWEQPHKIARYFRLTNMLPQTISGVFWFKKTPWCEKLFIRALEIYNDKHAPCQKWAGGKPDEYCFNVALCERNYQQGSVHFVYFDKTNGVMTREKMFSSFWGIAAGGNKLKEEVKDLYNELVVLFTSAFSIETKRFHVDKIAMIAERRTF